MGGYGSGQTGWKPKAEDLLKLDIRYMYKRGMLNLGTYSTYSWSRGNEKIASIGVIGWDNKITLHYSVKYNGSDEKTDQEEHIYLDWTDCYFGGQRPWFICAKCGDRAAVLYMRSRYFYCRSCNNITYASRCESTLDRLMRKQRKLRKRLTYDGTEDGDICFKPKGMHQKTFDRLLDEYYDIDRQIAYQMMMRFGVILW